ncbi:ABC transporter substrate-binding protein [Nonomuraea sp. NPDC003707]
MVTKRVRQISASTTAWQRLAAALVVVSTAVPLSGCAPSGVSGDSSEGGNRLTLSVWSWRTEDIAAYNAIFDVYEKEHPGVTIDFKAFKNTEYNQVLTTGLAGSSGPDVAQVRSYGQLQPTVAAGSLIPLDGVVDLGGWDASVVDSAKGKQDGKLYGVPLARQTLQMYYNTEIFAAKGLTPPTTWAEFLAVNARLKKQGVIPMAVGAKDAFVLPIVHQVLAAPRFGGASFEKAVLAGKKNFNDPDWVASVDLLSELKDCLPADAIGVAYTDAQVLFTSGKAAMFPGGSFELGFFQKQNPALKLGVFEVPAPPGSPLATPTTSGYADGAFGVSARSDAPEAAKDLVRWMSSKAFGQLVADRVKQLSAVPGVVYSDPLLRQMADNYARNPSPYLLLVDFRYGTPSGTDLLGTGIQEILLGKKNASEVGAALQTGVAQWFTPTGR